MAGRNNFALLGIIAVTITIYGNGLILTSAPPSGLWGAPMPRIGLDILFAAMGYLATLNWQRHGLSAYAALGARRLLPALAVCVLVTVFVIGPLSTTLSLRFYFLNGMTLRYLTNAVLLLHLWLPGVFEGQQWVGTVNPMFWTLVPGLVCCALIPLSSVVRPDMRPIASGASALALGGLSLLWPLLLPGLPSVLNRPVFADALTEAPFFVAGVTLALAERDLGERLWRADLAMLSFAATWAMASWLGSWTFVLELFTVPYMAVAFGRMALPGVQRLGNPTLGMYLYAFPVQQLIVQKRPGVAWSIPLCLAVAFLAGLVSWRLVESPFLHRRRTPARPE